MEEEGFIEEDWITAMLKKSIAKTQVHTINIKCF